MLMRRQLYALLLALFILAMSAPAAFAADQVRITGSGSFIAHSICTDPILVESSYDEVMHTYYDNAGNPVRLAFTGPVRITYTNLTTGARYSPNTSGPGTVDLANGQMVLRGGNGAMFDSTGTLVATDGRIVLDANGNMISLRGHVVGVCEQLGSTPR